MAIRCSIFGCVYEDTHIEREEERRGDEVILTVREYKECTNCGNVELISENTGVTSAAAADLDEPSDGSSDAADDGQRDDGPAGGRPESSPDDAPPAADIAAETTDDDGPTVRTPSSDVEVPDGFEPPAGDDPDPTPDPSDVALDQDDAATATADAGDDSPADEDGTATDDAVFIDGDGDGVGGSSGTTTTASSPKSPGAESDEEFPEDGRDAEFVDSGAAESTGGLDEAAAMEDGPSITGSIREAEEEFPEDDAVILDGSGGNDPDPDPGLDHEGWSDVDGTAERGGWPDHDDGTDTTVTDRGGWPDHDGSDRGRDPAPADGTSVDDAEFSGLTPSFGDTPDDGSTAENGPSGGATTVTADRPLTGESERAGTGVESDATADAHQAPTTEETTASGPQLFCSACGHAAAGSETAHRAGDICPSCSGEYLQER